MSIDWKTIKPFNNSQNNAFEELVCQLAREEIIADRNEFYRIAAPDGGVEAYCTLNNGDEYGWQAKYFSSMGTSQWKQLKDSFETALRTHPKLKKYFICIPLDRQDPRCPDQIWFMDHWNEKVQNWTQSALLQGREIQFEYWGSSELLHRLSQENNAGRRMYWFSNEDFSDKWFESQVNTSITNLGKRYTPDLNVKLPISEIFDAISRNGSFREQVTERFHAFLLKINKMIASTSGLPLGDNLANAVKELKVLYQNTQDKDLAYVEIEAISKVVKDVYGLIAEFDEIISEQKENKENYENKRHLINQAWEAIYEFDDYLSQPSLSLSNTPIVVLSGEAGIGKSHLLADIATTRIKEKKSCILLLGQHFTSDESPWTQILRNLLRLQCAEKELLGALSARAEAQGERLLFIVDAINEGRGRCFWPEHIRGFINDFAQYPWIGLILSVRSSYEKLLVPSDLIDSRKIVKVKHYGFSDFEHEASTFFFSQYDIEHPTIPLLHPEFSNPLFLKLFCEGLHRSGYRTVPKGYGGISNIIDFFLESVDKALSAPNKYDFPEGKKVVRRVVEELVKFKIEKNMPFVPYEDAFQIADTILSKFSNKRRFLDALISEGVVSANLFWKNRKDYEEGIYLSYERFDDHITTAFLLKLYLDEQCPDISFSGDTALAKYISGAEFKRGILESLAIQVPERTGKELYELLEEKQRCNIAIIDTFIASLIWRKPETIKPDTLTYVETYVLDDENGFDKFIQMAYSIASDPEHLYNADMLHRYFMSFSLADRDAFWTIYLHDQDYKGSAIRRLINWAKAETEKSYLSDESRLLLSKALAWLFVSTNIPLRDSATKALVILLEDKPNVIAELLISFKDVNDPYILERILAASYGAVLRSKNIANLSTLAECLVNTIFNNVEAYVNVLVRDYARNIIEYAIYKKTFILENPQQIRPPYKSSFPTSFPTNEETDSYDFDYSDANFKDYYWGQNAILHSMVTEYGRGICSYGDFGRYTFQSKLSSWGQFDPNVLSNYACKLIFEQYGYDVEKHGAFDRKASSGDRHKNRKERIGKKYQWIALYEVLARLSDNYKLLEESTRWDKDKKYGWFQGPWEPFVRNIDPTVVFNKQVESRPELNWWSTVDYNDWDYTHEQWLEKEDNLPNPIALIEPCSCLGQDWLILERHITWEEPTPIGIDKYEYPRKVLWYQIRSCLVEESAAESVIDYLNTQTLGGRWFPEGHESYQVFSREFYWSPAYRFFDNPYYGGTEWKDIFDRSSRGRLIGSVLPTSEGHQWESGADSEIQPSYLAPRELMFSKMNLQYSDNVGEWVDDAGQVICFDPSVNYQTSSCLVVRKDRFLRFLVENRMKVLWTCLGEKNIYGTMRMEHYPKWLEISGTYSIYNGQVEGKFNIINKN